MELSRVRRVLVVDDNEELAENIAEMLSLDGHAVCVANSAEEALPMVGSRELDFIVTDYRLPGITGAALVKMLRDRGETVHAIVISAYSDDRTITEAFEVGAKFISKPLDLLLLSRVVREAWS